MGITVALVARDVGVLVGLIEVDCALYSELHAALAYLVFTVNAHPVLFVDDHSPIETLLKSQYVPSISADIRRCESNLHETRFIFSKYNRMRKRKNRIHIMMVSRSQRFSDFGN